MRRSLPISMAQLMQAGINSFRRVVFSTQRIKTISHTRGYAKNHTQTKEQLQTYNRFKSNLRSSRVAFQNELKAQQVSMEDSSAKAVEEARLEKEAEKKALKANKIEVERMAIKREKAVALAEKRGLEKLKQGAQAREKWEQGRIDVRANEVLHVQRESESFITMDNLDQKIKEVIENEVDYNYALSRTGEKITSRNNVKSIPNLM